MGSFVKIEEESKNSKSSKKRENEEKEEREEEKEEEKDKKKRHNKKKEKPSKAPFELQLEYWDHIHTKEKKKTNKNSNNTNTNTNSNNSNIFVSSASNLNSILLENQPTKQKSLKGSFAHLSVLNLPELCKNYQIDSLNAPLPGSLFSLVIQYSEKKRRPKSSSKFLLLTPKSNQLLCNSLSSPFSVLVDDINYDNVR